MPLCEPQTGIELRIDEDKKIIEGEVYHSDLILEFTTRLKPVLQKGDGLRGV